MKATVREVKSYQVVLGNSCDDFTIESEWECFTKLSNEKGWVILHIEKHSLDVVFDAILKENMKDYEATVILASDYYKSFL